MEATTSTGREELDLFKFIYSLVLPDEWVTEQPEPAGKSVPQAKQLDVHLPASGPGQQ